MFEAGQRHRAKPKVAEVLLVRFHQGHTAQCMRLLRELAFKCKLLSERSGLGAESYMCFDGQSCTAKPDYNYTTCPPVNVMCIRALL